MRSGRRTITRARFVRMKTGTLPMTSSCARLGSSSLRTGAGLLPVSPNPTNGGNMSLLTATHEDFEARNGAPLPAGVYRVLVEQAGPEASQNGTQFKRMYGQIRTRDGATEISQNGNTFRIGNRKLFAR